MQTSQLQNDANETLSFFGINACRVLFRTALIGASFLAVVAYFLANSVLLTAAIFVSANLVILLWLLSQGRLMAAQIGVVVAFWLTAAYLILMAHGVRDTAILLYPPIFLFSGITLNRLFFWVVCTLSVGFLFIVGMAEHLSHLQTRYSDFPMGTDLMMIVVVLAVVAIFTDLFITSARRHIHAINHAKKSIEKAGRAKTEFLNMMSHEMRSPLNPILGYSDLLKADLEDPEHQTFLAEIQESSHHMVAMIESMLEYSRIADGTVPLQPEKVSLLELSDFIKEYAARRAEAKLLQFETESEHHDDACVLLDRKRLLQILKHLIANAIRVTDSGKVSLRLKVEEGNNTQLDLFAVIADNGPPLSPEQIDVLFEPFSDGEENIRKKGDVGLGLELAKCRQLARLMGGNLHCETSKQGANFILRVPVGPTG